MAEFRLTRWDDAERDVVKALAARRKETMTDFILRAISAEISRAMREDKAVAVFVRSMRKTV